jgi:hypothetical protein
MKKSRCVLASAYAAISLALVTATPYAVAENDITSAFTPQTPPNWELREHDAMDAVELISVLADGSFSTMCSDGACGVFVEPAAGCVPGTKYPLLINSAKQVGVVSTQCAVMPGNKEGEVRHVVLLQKQEVLIKAMMNEVDLTIAFPTQAGQMNVLEIRMSGVRDVLAKLMPDVEMPKTESESDGTSQSEASDPNKTADLKVHYHL